MPTTPSSHNLIVFVLGAKQYVQLAVHEYMTSSIYLFIAFGWWLEKIYKVVSAQIISRKDVDKLVEFEDIIIQRYNN